MLQSKTSKEAFLIFIGFCESDSQLSDESLYRDILKTIPTLIGMEIIREPVITHAVNNPGLECYVPIDMSNITMSTYTNGFKVVGCIHSCKEFDYKKVIDYIVSKLSFIKIDYKFISESDF